MAAEVPHTEAPAVTEAFTLFLLLRAFAVGSAVMTGTEAISNGIPAFKPPEPRNAAQTLVIDGRHPRRRCSWACRC